jgi:endonuclease III
MKQAREAARALEEQLGREAVPALGWTTVLNLVAPRRKTSGLAGDPSGMLSEGPEGMANRDPRELATLLEQDQRRGRQAATLRKLADWWLTEIGDAVPPEGARRGIGRRLLDERAMTRLRKIPGISQELADRIRLFALGEPVPPVGRAALRVGCRHAWCDLDSDPEEWQAWLRHWAGVAEVELWQLARWIDEVGARWCGPQPHCEDCPLSAFLPPSGPREPES